MNQHDFEVDPTDPRYISGIYNYCDRWCERCPFTARCSVFAMEQEMEDADAAHRDTENAAFWRNLEQVFDQTRVVINNVPRTIELDEDEDEEDDDNDDADQDFGNDIEDADFALYQAQEEAREAEIDQHPLSKSSYQYAKRVRDWFEEHDPLIPDDHDPSLTPEARDLADAASVVLWYEFQVHVKLRRALGRDDELEEQLADDGFPRDSDGSAKVALIGMDRSIAAWTRIQAHLPDHAAQVLDFMARLEELRTQTEKEFPQARAFIRPGFDTEDPST